MSELHFDGLFAKLYLIISQWLFTVSLHYSLGHGMVKVLLHGYVVRLDIVKIGAPLSLLSISR